MRVGHLRELLTSPYGRLVLAKIAVLIGLLVLGLRHFRIGGGRITATGITTLGYETCGGVVVVLLTAFLVGQSPPVHPSVADLSTPLDVASVNTASMYPALQIGDINARR